MQKRIFNTPVVKFYHYHNPIDLCVMSFHIWCFDAFFICCDVFSLRQKQKLSKRIATLLGSWLLLKYCVWRKEAAVNNLVLINVNKVFLFTWHLAPFNGIESSRPIVDMLVQKHRNNLVIII